MNKAILVWNITQDPQIKATENGVHIATTSIATNEFYKDANWEKQQQTEFHNLVAFGKTADLFENYIKKWQKILVEGKIKTRSWEADDGSKRYKTEIFVEKVEFLGWDKKPEENEAKQEAPQQAIKKKTPIQEEEISIEDIPF